MRHYTELIYTKWTNDRSPVWSYADALLARAMYNVGHLYFCVLPPEKYYSGKNDGEYITPSLNDAVNIYDKALADAVSHGTPKTNYPVLAVAFPDEEGRDKIFSIAIYGTTNDSYNVFASWEHIDRNPLEAYQVKQPVGSLPI